MTEPHAFLAPLAGIWLAAVILPGPNFLMVSREAVAESRAGGMRVALGVALGAGVWALAALLGLQALFALCPRILWILRLLGGLYLFYLGFKALLGALRPAARDLQARALPADNPARGSRNPLRLGLFTSFSNPKTAVFFGSVFGVLLPPDASVTLQAVSIVMLVLISASWYCTVAWLFSCSAPRRVYLVCKRPLDAILGGLFAALGLKLAFGR